MFYFRISSLSILAFFWSFLALGQAPYRVLIVDGQNDHSNWKQTSEMMKTYLEETGLFSVEISRNYPSEGGTMDSFKPDFSKYKVVLSNYNGSSWPSHIKDSFESFVKSGGGLVVIHAADNAFPDWEAYNEMIGVGSGRSEKAGPVVFYNEEIEKVVQNENDGGADLHGAEHAFKVKIRNKKHPITKDLPIIWMHEKDVLYNGLRGKGKNMEILATAHSAIDKKGAGRHEPVMMVINYGEGRVFHTTLGHDVESQKGIGFITVLQRGTEWAATGQVNQKVPANFPKERKGSKRP